MTKDPLERAIATLDDLEKKHSKRKEIKLRKIMSARNLISEIIGESIDATLCRHLEETKAYLNKQIEKQTAKEDVENN